MSNTNRNFHNAGLPVKPLNFSKLGANIMQPSATHHASHRATS